MKTCVKCGETKDESFFTRRGDSGLLRHDCKACKAAKEKQRRVDKADEIRAKDKKRWWADQNGRRQKSLARMRDRYISVVTDPQLHEEEKARNRARAKKYSAKWRATVARRRAAKLQATPNWLTPDDHWWFDEIYELVELREKATGIKWHADHIVPLQNKTVCGLHVPWNMRVIPAAENRSKGNRWEGW